MKHRFHPEAEAEFLDAVDWYAQHSFRRGLDYTDEIRGSINEICDEPFIWAFFEGDCRRVLTGRYPYSIIYLVENEEIIIVAVAHLSRKPGYWLSRVTKS